MSPMNYVRLVAYNSVDWVRLWVGFYGMVCGDYMLDQLYGRDFRIIVLVATI